jgi:hypothetical protein
MVALELTVFTEREPKLIELGKTPNPARVAAGKNIGPKNDNPTNRHTRSALFIPWQSLSLSSERVLDSEGGPSGCSESFVDIYI